MNENKTPRCITILKHSSTSNGSLRTLEKEKEEGVTIKLRNLLVGYHYIHDLTGDHELYSNSRCITLALHLIG